MFKENMSGIRKYFLLIGVLVHFSFAFGQFSLNTDEASVYFNYESENTDGTLSDVHATIELNWGDIGNSTIEGSVAVSSLSTGNKMRDKHLKSKDFFDAETYPKMFFSSDKIEKEGAVYYAVGRLKIKDIEKDVRFMIIEKEGSLNFETSIYAKDFEVATKKAREKSKVHIRVSVPLSE